MTDPAPSRSEGPLGPGWHAPPSLLARFVSDPVGLDDVTAASVESHLVACTGCRATLAAAASSSDVADSWDAIADRIDRPRPSVVEWFLDRLGVGGGFARLIGATPSLQLAGLAAIAGLAAAAAILSRHAEASGPFLVLAPLVPLAGVAATFAPAADPAGETGVATPLHGAGLALRRASVVVGAAFFLLALAGAGLPGLGLEGAGWVLPALALALGSLALGTWWRVELCVAALAATWLAVNWSIRLAEGRHLPLGDTAVFETTGQVTALAAALLATAVLTARRDRYATSEAQW